MSAVSRALCAYSETVLALVEGAAALVHEPVAGDGISAPIEIDITEAGHLKPIIVPN